MELHVSKALESINREISPKGYEMLSKLVAWGDCWDQMHSGEKFEMTDAHNTAMLAPFTGFGDPAMWAATAPGVNSVIMSRLMTWLASPDSDRFSMAESILLEVAPLLCVLERGPEGFRRSFSILKSQLRKRPS